MNIFSRSWQITKSSMAVIRADKEMLLFPLLSGISSLLFLAAMVYPTIIVDLRQDGDFQATALQYLVLFVTYLGLAFVATFFNVCMVYTTRVRFGGGDATFGDSIRFAGSRLGRILAWSLVSATVGLVLRVLDHLAARAGGIGELLINILTSILGLLWSVITIFVVPVMVYENLGPVDAIRRSTETIKQTWGESLVRHFGLGLIQFLILLVGGLLLGALAYGLAMSMAGAGAVIGISLLVLFVLSVLVIFSALNAVFNTALYVYAQTGEVPGAFDAGTVNGAFRHR